MKCMKIIKVPHIIGTVGRSAAMCSLISARIGPLKLYVVPPTFHFCDVLCVLHSNGTGYSTTYHHNTNISQSIAHICIASQHKYSLHKKAEKDVKGDEIPAPPRYIILFCASSSTPKTPSSVSTDPTNV